LGDWPLSDSRDVRYGHVALSDQVKFAAEKQPPRFESSGPAKTIDEEGIDLLIGSL
jgi:hypothetical protein